jgi:hypothetical protein
MEGDTADYLEKSFNGCAQLSSGRNNQTLHGIAPSLNSLYKKF